MCGLLDVVCELFVKVFGLLFVCYCCFVIKGDGDVWRLWRFLCVGPFIVFQSVWMFVLWSQLSVMCCLQSACLWFGISLFMLVFCCAISGSLRFCCLDLLRCFIMFLMCSGSSLCVWCIFH